MTATATYSLDELRTYDPNYRPACMGNWYCPACSCNKSGYAEEPNGRTEACTDEGCACHRDARCSCCDGRDGLGFYHFDTVDQLRRFLATPGHETTIDIDVAHVPGEPCGVCFVTAGEAEAWLDEYDEQVTADIAELVEMERRAERHGARA